MIGDKPLFFDFHMVLEVIRAHKVLLNEPLERELRDFEHFVQELNLHHNLTVYTFDRWKFQK